MGAIETINFPYQWFGGEMAALEQIQPTMKFTAIITSILGAFTLFAATAAESAKPKTTGEKLITEFLTTVYNPPYDLTAIDRLCTEDFILTTSGKDVVGRAVFKEWVKSFKGKIRDMRLELLDVFPSADGTRAVSRWRATGFNRGMFGTPADDQPVEFTGIAVFEVRDGKLSHNWVERSAYELMQRLQGAKK
jgi:hypothetical protein